MIEKMENGQIMEVDCVVKKATDNEASNGNPYVTLELSVKEESFSAKMWNATLASTQIEAGKIIRATLRMTIKGTSKYLDIQKFEFLPDANLMEFIEHPDFDIKTAYKHICDVVNHFSDEQLKRVTVELLKSKGNLLVNWAGAVVVHHNCRFGLLYHIYRMLLSAEAMYAHYNCNPELLFAGVIWHDIGKIEEIKTDMFGAAEFTVQGNLFGHSYLGCRMLRKIMTEHNIAETENLMLLEHMIASHHGKKEWGAITSPSVKEAYILHLLDNNDSKMYQFEKIEASLAPGELSGSNRYLEGIYVYRSNSENK